MVLGSDKVFNLCLLHCWHPGTLRFNAYSSLIAFSILLGQRKLTLRDSNLCSHMSEALESLSCNTRPPHELT